MLTTVPGRSIGGVSPVNPASIIVPEFKTKWLPVTLLGADTKLGYEVAERFRQSEATQEFVGILIPAIYFHPDLEEQ